MSKFMGQGTPGVGAYDPLSHGLEDKQKLKLLKRLNMYATSQGKDKFSTFHGSNPRATSKDEEALKEKAA